MSGQLTAQDTARVYRPIRRGPVVLATAGDDKSDAAVTASVLIAKRLGEPIEIVSVIEPIPFYDDVPTVPAMMLDDYRQQRRETRVRAAVRPFMPRETEWPLTMRIGSIAREIAEVGRSRGASIIVVGGGGPTAAQVLRQADCPVWAAGRDTTGVVHRVVVAMDFGAPSIRAAEAALKLVEPDGTVMLVHVVSDLEFQVDEAIADAAAQFDQLRAELAPHVRQGVRIETRVVRGTIKAALLSVVGEVQADLLAVGTHGPQILERMFVGSTAARMLHAASCSVLACPAPSAADGLFMRLRMTGTLTTPERAAWGTLLDRVTARDAGRRVSIEVDDPEIGGQVEGTGLVFSGATYDPHDGRISLMCADAGVRTRNLTRTVAHADAIALYAGPDGRDIALEARHGRGATILTFSDAPA